MSIPNILSIFRIVLIPVFSASYLMLPPEQIWVAAAVLVLSGVTDIADGIIARKFNMTTQLGKVLDPAADKLTLAAVCGTLAVKHPVLLPLFVVYVVKELLMLIGGIVIWKKGMRIQSSKWFGKMATVVFYAAMFVIIVLPELSQQWVLLLAILLTVTILFALLMYINEFLKLKKQK